MIDTAIIVCPEESSPEAQLLGLQVAGLPLLRRALLATQQAGLTRAWVVASAAQRAILEPQVASDPRLAGRVSWRDPQEEELPPAALVLTPLVVVEGGALRSWLTGAEAVKGILAPEESEAGPVVARGPALRACVRAARSGLEALATFLREAWDEGRVAFRRWPASRPGVLASPAMVPAVERSLLRALRTPDDGPLVDRFVNRTLSSGLSRWLVRRPVTPNQVTVASLAAGLLGAWLLSRTGAAASLAGLALFQLSVVLDHSDGEIARLKFRFSRVGKWLDNFSDHAVDLAVVAGLAWRAASGASSAGLILLAVVAGAGLTGSFLVVFCWTLRRGAEGFRGPAAMHPLLALANRDGFCLALWASVLLGVPVLLLWLLAVGANAYWLLWLAIARRGRRPGGGVR